MNERAAHEGDFAIEPLGESMLLLRFGAGLDPRYIAAILAELG